MSNRKVKLKNLDGDYLYPYTDNVPTDKTVTASSANLITSGAVHAALSQLTQQQNSMKTELNSAIQTAKSEAITAAKFKYTVTNALPSNPEADRFYFITT